MRFLIRNPAPGEDSERNFWGDRHFGEALEVALESLGHQVESQYWPSWDAAEADVLLVLRGIRECLETPGEFDTKMIWTISHPEDVSEDELRLFDLVLCGSNRHAAELRASGFNTHTLLQCTKSRLFYAGDRDVGALENAFVFVGNWRGNNRNLVGRSISAELPLKIWGRGWTRSVRSRCVVRDSIPNADLGHLYRTSYCSLNDHWGDMSEYEYVNNRLFDALACALPVLSDPNEGMSTLGFSGVKIIRSEDSFQDEIDEFVMNYDRYQERAYLDSAVILEKHTFAARARQLLELLD